MKKTVILFVIITFWSAVAIAAEPFFGEWQYKESKGSVIYIFEPAQAGQIAGQGKIVFIPSSEQYKQLTFPFMYVVERKVTAESSIDTFWEYTLKIWFPSQKETIEARIVMQEGKVSISEGGRNLTLVKR